MKTGWKVLLVKESPYERDHWWVVVYNAYENAVQHWEIPNFNNDSYDLSQITQFMA